MPPSCPLECRRQQLLASVGQVWAAWKSYMYFRAGGKAGVQWQRTFPLEHVHPRAREPHTLPERVQVVFAGCNRQKCRMVIPGWSGVLGSQATFHARPWHSRGWGGCHQGALCPGHPCRHREASTEFGQAAERGVTPPALSPSPAGGGSPPPPEPAACSSLSPLTTPVLGKPLLHRAAGAVPAGTKGSCPGSRPCLS